MPSRRSRHLDPDRRWTYRDDFEWGPVEAFVGGQPVVIGRVVLRQGETGWVQVITDNTDDPTKAFKLRVYGILDSDLVEMDIAASTQAVKVAESASDIAVAQKVLSDGLAFGYPAHGCDEYVFAIINTSGGVTDNIMRGRLAIRVHGSENARPASGGSAIGGAGGHTPIGITGRLHP